MYTKCRGVAAYLYHNYIVLCFYVKGIKLLNIYLQITSLFGLRVFYYAYHVFCIGLCLWSVRVCVFLLVLCACVGVKIEWSYYVHGTNTIHIYMFRTHGLIFRNTAVTGTLRYNVSVSTCMVHRGYAKTAAVLYVEERFGSIACKTESSLDCCLLGCDAVQTGIWVLKLWRILLSFWLL